MRQLGTLPERFRPAIQSYGVIEYRDASGYIEVGVSGGVNVMAYVTGDYSGQVVFATK